MYTLCLDCNDWMHFTSVHCYECGKCHMLGFRRWRSGPFASQAHNWCITFQYALLQHQLEQHQQHTSISQPCNAPDGVRSKPAPSATPTNKRTRSCLASPPTPAPVTSPRKRVLLPAPPAASYDTFEEEFAAIVASECARDPRAEGRLKAFAQFFMGGVVDRAELAEK